LPGGDFPAASLQGLRRTPKGHRELNEIGDGGKEIAQEVTARNA
jgi:hypothetical protein